MASPPGRAEPSWSQVARAAAGDRDARDAFAGTYLPVVRAFFAARWGGGPHAAAADDAVQQVFVECLRPGGALARADPARGDLRALLYGVCANVARRAEARAGRPSGVAGSESALARVPDGERSVSVLFDREWARSVVRRAGDRMLEHARSADEEARQRVELLRLRFSDGLPIREIATRWGVDPDALHRSYARARREFEASLREVVRESGGGGASVDEEVARLLDLLG